MALVDRGDVFDADLPEIGPHPIVVVSRQTTLPFRSTVTVVLVTSVVRGHGAEVALGPGEGLDYECVANCDEIHTIRKQRLIRRRGSIGVERTGAIDAALRLSLGLDSG
jgi:mRNA-degrading endonuclease toxin of MazEF toxin-antitoxin module